MAETQAADQLLFCPSCGYDLRATPGDRCSECGLQLDRAALQESGFPWAHRQKIGRLRAYVRTVWQVTINSRSLAMESARPQEPRDGRIFHRVMAGVVAASLLGTWTWLVVMARGLAFVALPPTRLLYANPVWIPRWLPDLTVPWSAGATLPWVIPVGLTLLAIYLTGVQQAVFRVGTMPPAHQRRARTIANYAAAPLAILLGVPVLLVLTSLAASNVFKMMPLAMALGSATAPVTILALIGTLWRVGQWAYHMRRSGTGVSVPAMLELAGLWLLGVILFLGLVPWCIGFARIVIDSFR